jgi:hypothetical protein
METRVNIPFLKKTVTVKKRLSDVEVLAYNFGALLAGISYLLLSSALVALALSHLASYYGSNIAVQWYHPAFCWGIVGESVSLTRGIMRYNTHLE